MSRKESTSIFFELIRAGLFPVDGGTYIDESSTDDWKEVYRIAEEQSVVGLIAAGIEKCQAKVPSEIKLQIVGETLQLEQRNKAMNEFVARLIEKLRNAGIYTLLVKGQGVAQCYDRPLWRACGDVDLFLSEENFVRARELIRQHVDGFDPDDDYARSISATMDGWPIELHGNQNTRLSARIDNGLQRVQDDIFHYGSVRSWDNGKTVVYLPSANNDVLIIFTHFLKHFFKGGLGLRQICDWCRLLWTYRTGIKVKLLEERLTEMGLISEWKAFAAYAVEWLGMPSDAMPIYSNDKKWTRKAQRINDFVLEVGNMGHSRDNSFYGDKSFIVRKMFSMGRRISDICRHARIFPLDSLRFMPSILLNGLKGAAKGVG